MEITELQFCCAVYEIGEFCTLGGDIVCENGHRGDNGIKAMSKKEELEFVTDILSCEMRKGRTHIATTIPSQKLAIAGLKKLGFIPTRPSRGRFRNKITLWYKLGNR